jgi:16S rRNA (cytosine967-C5)-methyltransferase
LLRQVLDRADLSAVDEALATELTYGTLRQRALVDWALGQFTRTPLDALPPRIRTVLRLSAYQLLFLDRVPARAACSEAVELAKRVGHPGTARLVNAVMRRLAASPPVIPADEETVEGIALRYSHPAWLVRRWVDRFGLDGTRALCAANNRTPPSAIRLNTLRGTPLHVAQRLAEMGVATLPSRLLPEGRRILSAAPAARQAAHEGGWVSYQDEGSMLVSRLVAPRPGEMVIDACAAPGGKTTHLAALMENDGRVVACDLRPAKLAALDRHCTRLGVTIVESRHLDALRVGAEYPEAADRVLVDAPCSGLGVLRRRPEIRWRLSPDHLAGLAARQRAILWGASSAVRPGGLLVYSVCSVEPEEGPAIASAFLASRPEFEPLAIAGWPTGGEGGAPPTVPDAPGTAFLYPHLSDTDGFFVAAFRRRH